MPTLPYLATALHDLLTTCAERAGRTSGFVQRASLFTGATFTQTLVFGFLSNPDATLEHLGQTAAALGCPASPQAIDQRFTPAAATCLHDVLADALSAVIAAAPVAIPVLNRFTAVFIQDSSTIVLPDALAPIWHGCGGATTARTSASLKLQVRLDLRTGRLQGPQLQHGRASDHEAALPTTLPSGSLRLADLGYWSLDELQTLEEQGVYWLSRLQAATAVFDDQGRRRDVLKLLEKHSSHEVDVPIFLGARHRIRARVLARKVPQEVADQRRRRLREEARRKGKTVRAERLALAAWTILVTNVASEMLTLEEAVVLARTRWQIELLFKLWKSHGKVDVSRSGKAWRMLCEVYAKLLAMVVQHWVFLVSCWAYPDRSLVKAAQTVRSHGLHLASAFGEQEHLVRALSVIQRCLRSGCRLNRRKKAPNTYQLLLDLTAEPALA